MKNFAIGFLGILLAATTAFSDGGMISSGGELLKDAQNPWWVKNTKEVKYCIDVDTATFSASPAVVSMLVNKVLKFWRIEFGRQLTIVKNSASINSYFNYAGIGTQEFIKVPCSGQEDLRLQFGYGTLSKEQKDYIKNISTQVGIAVRTSYDEVNLRGKGYIYIASDLGPNQFKREPGMIEKPWSIQAVLYLALQHELGHVFGIPHIGENYTLMSQQFLEYVLNKEFAKWYAGIKLDEFEPSPFFFAPSSLLYHCSKAVNAQVKNYLDIPANHECLVIYVDSASREIQVYSSNEPNGKYEKVGDIVRLNLDADVVLGTTVIINPKQKVFPQVSNPLSLIVGPGFVRKKGNGIYRNAKGDERTLFVNLGSQGFELVGLVNGEIKTLITAPILVEAKQNLFGRVKP